MINKILLGWVNSDLCFDRYTAKLYYDTGKVLLVKIYQNGKVCKFIEHPLEDYWEEQLAEEEANTILDFPVFMLLPNVWQNFSIRHFLQSEVTG